MQNILIAICILFVIRYFVRMEVRTKKAKNYVAKMRADGWEGIDNLTYLSFV